MFIPVFEGAVVCDLACFIANVWILVRGPLCAFLIEGGLRFHYKRARKKLDSMAEKSC